MDISFACDKCGQHLVIDQAGAGLAVTCPECSAILSVRTLAEAPPKTLSDAMPQESGAPVNTRENSLKSYVDFIDPLNFCGKFRNSLNGLYAVAWGSTEQGRGGGKYDRVYLLLRNGVVVLKGTRTAIGSAVVADNGTFLVCHTSKSGTNIVEVFDPEGTRLKQMRFRWIYDPTFDVQKRTANLEIPADWANYPSGSLTFNLLDGTAEVVKPCNRPPY